MFSNLLIYTKKLLKKKHVNDNGTVNDDNAASDSLEQDICAISSDDLMIFSNSLEQVERSHGVYL